MAITKVVYNTTLATISRNLNNLGILLLTINAYHLILRIHVHDSLAWPWSWIWATSWILILSMFILDRLNRRRVIDYLRYLRKCLVQIVRRFSYNLSCSAYLDYIIAFRAVLSLEGFVQFGWVIFMLELSSLFR